MQNDCVYDTFTSPVGQLFLVAGIKGLRAVTWERKPALPRSPRHPILNEARTQLREYFDGRRRKFDVPLDLDGTDFQLRAWKELARIPYGRTISYGEQARRIGDAKKARAVGTANARNPLFIIIPCHRVIGKDGSLAGFACGIENKRLLLDLERRASRG